ncbi:MAG: TIGR03067 domain-containing protein [Alphaproteobacteria bacterium]
MSDQLSRVDLAALQGLWVQVSLEVDGISNPPDDLSPPGAITTFSGNRYVVRTIAGQVLIEGTFTLDASANPKTINWKDSIGPDVGRELPAIYNLGGDYFTFVAADEGAPRPKDFKTTAGQTMRNFVRRTSN